MKCSNRGCKKKTFDNWDYCESCLWESKCDARTLHNITCYKQDCNEIALNDYLMPGNMKACEHHNALDIANGKARDARKAILAAKQIELRNQIYNQVKE